MPRRESNGSKVTADSHVDAFAVIGFVFGIIALGAANSAKAQFAALKKEVDTLRAAEQNRSE